MDCMKELADSLQEPYIYLSALQHQRCESNTVLKDYSPLLPTWVPQRVIAKAFGFSPLGMKNAVRSLGGKPYVWATEFENVHAIWRYHEPELEMDGVVYRCSEDYFHSQKPFPFRKKEWDGERVHVMERAVRAKFAADRETLEPLLRSTKKYTLLSVKNDTFWGVSPSHGGENMLAKIWMKIRGEIYEE
jgi:predicted NAD-dependent protein-ADP-ribosyltransferase YbiA (DUF1768 family)